MIRPTQKSRLLTQHIQEFCQVSPGPFPRSARGPGYEATPVRVKCKTWTLDSGLDYGLDCGLTFGLGIGLIDACAIVISSSWLQMLHVAAFVEMAGDSLSTAIVISSYSEDEEEEIESDGALVFTPTKR